MVDSVWIIRQLDEEVVGVFSTKKAAEFKVNTIIEQNEDYVYEMVENKEDLIFWQSNSNFIVIKKWKLEHELGINFKNARTSY